MPSLTAAGTSSMSLYSLASSSSVGMQTTFQSSSPSSIMAITPNGLTSATVPMARALDPISTTSMGSSSPKHFNSGCSSLGSSQV